MLASLTTEIEITEEQKQIIIFHRIAMELALPAISSSITWRLCIYISNELLFELPLPLLFTLSSLQSLHFILVRCTIFIRIFNCKLCIYAPLHLLVDVSSWWTLVFGKHEVNYLMHLFFQLNTMTLKLSVIHKKRIATLGNICWVRHLKTMSSCY